MRHAYPEIRQTRDSGKLTRNSCRGPGKAFIESLGDFAPPTVRDMEPVEMAVIYVDKKGKRRVKGGGDLKASQAYQFRGCIDVCLKAAV